MIHHQYKCHLPAGGAQRHRRHREGYRKQLRVVRQFGCVASVMTTVDSRKNTLRIEKGPPPGPSGSRHCVRQVRKADRGALSLAYVPYDSGLRDIRMRRGPPVLARAGAADQLRRRGHPVEERFVEVESAWRAELTTTLNCSTWSPPKPLPPGTTGRHTSRQGRRRARRGSPLASCCHEAASTFEVVEAGRGDVRPSSPAATHPTSSCVRVGPRFERGQVIERPSPLWHDLLRRRCQCAS